MKTLDYHIVAGRESLTHIEIHPNTTKHHAGKALEPVIPRKELSKNPNRNDFLKFQGTNAHHKRFENIEKSPHVLSKVKKAPTFQFDKQLGRIATKARESLPAYDGATLSKERMLPKLSGGIQSFQRQP